MAINKDGSIRKKKGETVHQRWLKENGYVSTGSQLSGMIGVSMQKIRLAMEAEHLKFPKPVIAVKSYQRGVLYFKKTDIEEFMTRFDLKVVRLDGYTPTKGSVGRFVPSRIKTFDQRAALSFLIGRPVTGIDCGVSRYGDQ